MRQGRRYVERDEGSISASRISDLFVASTDGSRAIRLTRTPKMLEAQLTWDPSGERLAFVQFGTVSEFWETFGFGNAIVQINADGTCRTKVFSSRNAAAFGAAWQPGSGREAGRIVC